MTTATPARESAGRPPRPSRRAPRWLPLALALALLAGAGGLAYGAYDAWRYADRVHHWPSTVGTIETDPLADGRGPGLIYYDHDGHRRVLWLAVGDLDDMPAGSRIRVSYDPQSAAATLTTEAGARVSALATLGGVSLALSGCCLLWSRARTRADTRTRTSTEPPAAQRSRPSPRRRR